MNEYSNKNSILKLIFYIGFSITLIYGIILINGIGTHRYHDTIHVKSFNCTCLTDDTQYQCVQEAIRIGESIDGTWCNRIETFGKPLQYQFCYCKVTEIRKTTKNRCSIEHCHMIDNPVVDIPERCDKEKCNGCVALKVWLTFAILGALLGFAIIFAISHAICKALNNSDRNIDFSECGFLHALAAVPPTVVAFSLLTTNVLKHYSDLRLYAWAWTMLIGFGAPMLVVWVYQIRKFYLNTK